MRADDGQVPHPGLVAVAWTTNRIVVLKRHSIISAEQRITHPS